MCIEMTDRDLNPEHFARESTEEKGNERSGTIARLLSWHLGDPRPLRSLPGQIKQPERTHGWINLRARTIAIETRHDSTRRVVQSRTAVR